MITINDQPWEYVGLLNECLRILLTVALGAIVAYFEVFDAKTFVPQTVNFVFRVALPMHIMRGIGIFVDFYNPDFQWNYITAFLILRAIALVVSFGWVLSSTVCGDKNNGIGQVVVLWLLLTWISTVIMGIPITRAVFFGSEQQGLTYGLLAGISSFIFQLPLQLLFLECHILEEEYVQARGRPSVESPDEEDGAPEEAPRRRLEGDSPLSEQPEKSNHKVTSSEMNSDETNEPLRLVLWLQFARRMDIWKRISYALVSNPIIWGIVIGFALSLSKLGPRFLRPISEDYVPGLGWINDTMEWFGNMVSPLSLFAMGVWMQNQGKKLFTTSIHTAILSMFSKLFLVPLIMVGLAKGLDLSNNAGRAAVIIASLPISMAAFSLGSHYKIGEALLSENIALGTLLMLPTVLIWVKVMDEIDLFPLTPLTPPAQ